jgi:hypothetical protein
MWGADSYTGNFYTVVANARQGRAQELREGSQEEASQADMKEEGQGVWLKWKVRKSGAWNFVLGETLPLIHSACAPWLCHLLTVHVE